MSTTTVDMAPPDPHGGAATISTDEPNRTRHTQAQVYVALAALAMVVVALASVGMLLAPSTHIGNPDFRPAIQLLGGMVGLAAGFALAAHFHALGLRFFLFVGMAFLIEGSVDIISGIIQFSTEHGAATPVMSPAAFLAWTYMLGRLMLGGFLLVAASLPERVRSRSTANQLTVATLIALGISVVMTSTMSRITPPVPIFPNWFVSRPLDFLSAMFLLVALVAFLRKYCANRETILWWLLMLIAVSLVGEVMMSFSKRFYDPYYDIGYLYKSIAEVVFLMGVSLHTAEVLRERDHTQRRIATLNEHLRALAVVDDLTRLYNRRGFLELARQELKIADRVGRHSMLFYIDLDGMKEINDRYGHTEGDRALIEVSDVLRETFRDADIIARVGGDEFVVLAILAAPGDSDALQQRLAATLARHNAAERKPCPLELSVGCADYEPDSPCDIDELVQRADQKMYDNKRARQSDRNGV